MTTKAATIEKQNLLKSFFFSNRGMLSLLLFLLFFPFLISLLSGQSFSEVLANESGLSKFYQGLAIEIFILAVYALSYDLLLGVTGLLSFGHALFYGAGAYLTGIMLKSFGWSLLETVVLVVLIGIVLSLLVSVVLPRVKGITFALVTLGMAQVFHVIIQSRELVDYAGAEIGLQGVNPPEWINPSIHRLRFYYIALAFMFLIYFFYRRFADSPTGRVCIAIRENEDRATMLGYNTFYFKLIALIIAGVTASLAGAVHALFHPLIRPGVADVGFTITALLMVLMGGVGTLSGAIVGAATLRLLSYIFDRFFGEMSQVIVGVLYILIVLYLPYGIVGTWRLREFRIKQGRDRLLKLLKLKKPDE
jgi:branched-chain amino acid transport system permease protein